MKWVVGRLTSVPLPLAGAVFALRYFAGMGTAARSVAWPGLLKFTTSRP